MILKKIRVVSWVTTEFSRTLYHPQDGSPHPRAPPIPGFCRIFDCTPTSSSTPGFSTTPPSPNTPGVGHLSLPSSIPLRQFAPFEGLLFGILQRAAGVSLHSGTPLHTLGVSPHSSIRVCGGVSILTLGVSPHSPPRVYEGIYLYSPPPRLTKMLSLHSRGKQGEDRRTRRRSPREPRPRMQASPRLSLPMLLLRPQRLAPLR